MKGFAFLTLSNFYLDVYRNKLPGHIQLDEGLVDFLECQEIEHLMGGIGRLVQIVVAEGLYCFIVSASCAEDIV